MPRLSSVSGPEPKAQGFDSKLLSSKVWFCLKSILLVCLSRSVYTCIYVFPVLSSHVRLSWCYKWEDFMGVCRDLASSCKQSGHGVAFCTRLFEKYTYLLLVKIYIFPVLDPVGPFNQLGAIFAYRRSKWLSVNWRRPISNSVWVPEGSL